MYDTENFVYDRLKGLEAPIRSFGAELGIVWATDGDNGYHVFVPENNPVYPKSPDLVEEITNYLSCLPNNSGVPVFLGYASPDSGSIGGTIPDHLLPNVSPELYAKSIATLVYYAGKEKA